MFKTNAKELRRALKEIKRAEKNGFMYCEAVFKPVATTNDTWVVLAYSDLIEKAHPTDGNYSWGRYQGVTENNVFKNGKLVKKNRGK